MHRWLSYQQPSTKYVLICGEEPGRRRNGEMETEYFCEWVFDVRYFCGVLKHSKFFALCAFSCSLTTRPEHSTLHSSRKRPGKDEVTTMSTFVPAGHIQDYKLVLSQTNDQQSSRPCLPTMLRRPLLDC